MGECVNNLHGINQNLYFIHVVRALLAAALALDMKKEAAESWSE